MLSEHHEKYLDIATRKDPEHHSPQHHKPGNDLNRNTVLRRIPHWKSVLYTGITKQNSIKKIQK